MSLDNLRRDGQAKSGSSCGSCSGCIRAIETFRQMTNHLWRNVPAFIMHGYPNPLVAATLCYDSHGSVGWTVTDRIVDQVGQQAKQLIAAAPNDKLRNRLIENDRNPSRGFGEQAD